MDGEKSGAGWLVRAGRGGTHVDDYLEQGFVGLGYGEALDELPRTPSREGLVERFRVAHPGWREGKLRNAAGQLYRFLAEVSVGDPVVTVDPSRRLYILGTVRSEPERQAGVDLPIRREVEWTHVAPRDVLSVPSRNTLGSTLSLFRLPREVMEELFANRRSISEADSSSESSAPASTPSSGDADDLASLDGLLHDIQERSRGFIEDRIASLDADEMEELVAGILRAMGYKTRVAAKGPDRGVDVFASPDGLGLQEPRIFVEVKHRRASMGSQDVRSFLGGRQRGDRCLYVSTGGFTKEARYEADRSNVPLQLVDLPMLRELLVEHYDAVDLETKQLVPLTRVYWPLEEDR